MFEQYGDYVWVALFSALVLYGLGNLIQVPWLVKRFYRGMSLVSRGNSDFSEPPYEHSRVLTDLVATDVYVGDYKNHRIEQFSAFAKDRRKFTLNKVKRKQNQNVWTISILHHNVDLVSFCARPVRVPDAPAYVLNGDGVYFDNDEQFANKVHVLADDQTEVKKRFTSVLRDTLAGNEPLSLESAGSLLILKSPRQPHDAGRKLQQELDTLIELFNELQADENSA